MSDNDNELIHELIGTRYDFAAAVIEYHKSDRYNDALLDRMTECERAYQEAWITKITPALTEAFACRERDIDQLRKLLAIPPEGNA